MSIGVEGQYIVSFTLGRYSDFISESDLLKFVMIEECGNVLPTFELVFYIRDDRYLGLLTETNALKVSFGKTQENLVDTQLNISNLEAVGHGSSKRTVVINGFITNTAYIYNTQINITEKISAIEALSELATANNFIPKFNVEKSSDSQYWVQANVSAKRFANDLWLHSDIPDSFCGLAIGSDNSFIVKDIKKLISEDYKWRFTLSSNESNDIPYDTDLTVSSQSGLINYWAGYGQNKLIFDLENEDFRFVSQEAKPVIALTKEIARKSGIEKRYMNTGMQNENVHVNYWQAALRNITNLVIFGSIRVRLSFRDTYKDIKPLDLVLFNESDIANPSLSTEFHSGLYIVSKVSRQIQNRQYVTTVDLNRESFNQVVGDVRVSSDEEAEGFSEEPTTIFDEFLEYFS